MERPKHARSVEPTLDGTPDQVPQLQPQHAVALVEGNTPQLSAETHDLLRDRLRIASLLLFAGLLAFFVKGLFELDQIRTPIQWWIFGCHLAVTLIAGLAGARLCVNCPHALRHLRLIESLVFGSTALFFLLLSWWLLSETAPRGYLASIAPLWMLLIFTYALYIPNPWRRAAAVIGLMAALPILLVLAFRFASADFARVVTTNPDYYGYDLEIGMAVAFTALIAVWGVRTIWTLRKQAFEAKQLGQYRLKQRIGAGGMGTVYLAEHVLLKRPCAIKLIRPEKAGDAKALARFEREVQATAKLTHWNSVEIFDYGRADDGTFYYVMEYLPGMNLGALVDMHGPLPAERVIHLLVQVCDALGESHRLGMIHRDLKPANIFATKLGNIYDVAKLLDFGLAKPLAEEGDAALTQEGAITGSPLFMSPEQASGEQVDARSDIYALGVVMYYLLTGRAPFSGENPMRLLLAHVQQTPPPPSELVPDVPADLEAIVLRCLEKDPARRFPDTESLRSALEDCASAGLWTREMARCWWECHGCPKKKALDAKVFDARPA